MRARLAWGLIAERDGSEWTATEAPAILPAKRTTCGDGVQTVGDAQSLVTTRNDIVAGFRWQAEEKARRAVNRRPNGTPYQRAKGTPCQDGGTLM